jgi:hypothetical protein
MNKLQETIKRFGCEKVAKAAGISRWGVRIWMLNGSLPQRVPDERRNAYAKALANLSGADMDDFLR